MCKLPPADLAHILTHTGDLWQHLRGAHVFITGGTGFFGRWLLESALAANQQWALGLHVTVLTRDPAAFLVAHPHLAQQDMFDFLAGDIRSFPFPDRAFDYLIHGATSASARLIAEDPLGMWDVIVSGTRRVLDFAKSQHLRGLLFISSGAVYGVQPPELAGMPEDYRGGPNPLHPVSVYGEGKRAAELLCALYSQQYAIPVKIARGFAFVGPGLPLDTHYAAGNFIRDALRGGPITVNGDGTPYRAYLYAADLAIWLWTILLNGVSCRPYNVGSEEAISIAGLAGAVAQQFSPPPAVIVAQAACDGAASSRYVPSTRRPREELGLRQQISLADGLVRTIRAVRGMA
ncbi:MAG TPA: NAD-dependent epimerase/dehydratase family protein [Armatimonadota bacterium]|jgi:dTDP-glucose 4,6-dehydratase